MPMKRVTGLVGLGRAITADLFAGVPHHRLLQTQTTDPLWSKSNPQWISQKLADRCCLPVTFTRRTVSLYSASASVSSAVQEVRTVSGQSKSEGFMPKEVVLYQYEACPFCNKVKAFMDYYKLQYKVVEVNPINKKEIKWSEYKKVPILTVDGEHMVDSSVIIDRLIKRINPEYNLENEEEKKWRGWVDNHLVHVLSPNIYRSISEALESFDYITTKGNFSFMERLMGKYAGAAAMYIVSKKLKKKHNITDERAALYEDAKTWVDALNGREFHGGSNPNLADLAVFGVLRPIRYLKSGRDMVENTSIGDWYSQMESAVEQSCGIRT